MTESLLQNFRDSEAVLRGRDQVQDPGSRYRLEVNEITPNLEDGNLASITPAARMGSFTEPAQSRRNSSMPTPARKEILSKALNDLKGVENERSTRERSAQLEDEQQLELLLKIREKVKDRIELQNNYRKAMFFGMYISLFFYCVYTQMDTSRTYDIEQSLLHTYVYPLTTKSEYKTRSQFYTWVRERLLTPFEFSSCGNGICEPPEEYPGVGRFGCSLDCLEYPNTTSVLVRVSLPTVEPEVQAYMNSRGIDPKFRWNLWSANLEDLVFAEHQAVFDLLVPAQVPDGDLFLVAYQMQPLYGNPFQKEVLAQMVPADITTMDDPLPYVDFSYGSFWEAVVWSAALPFAAGDFDLDHYQSNLTHPLGATGVHYGISGEIFVETEEEEFTYDEGQYHSWEQCRIAPEVVAQHLNSSNCVASLDGKCYDLRSLQRHWNCPRPGRIPADGIYVQRFTPPGQQPLRVRPLDGPARLATPSNLLVSAVVLAQTRWDAAACEVSLQCGASCQQTRNSVLGTFGQERRCLDGSSTAPFGIDPFFVPAIEDLYAGLPPDAFYKEGEFRASGLPYGFFALAPEVVEGNSHFTAQHFNVYLDARMNQHQAQRAVRVMEEGFWYDNRTQTIDVMLMTYNAELDAIAQLRVLFTITRGGEVLLRYTIASLSLMDYIWLDTTVILSAFVTAVAITLLALEIPAILELRHNSKKLIRYFLSPRAILDWIGYVSIPLSLWYFVYRARGIAGSLSLTDGDPRGDLPFPLRSPAATARIFETDGTQEAATLQMMAACLSWAEYLNWHVAWTALNVFILICRFFQLVHFQARLGLITRTFLVAASDIAHFLLIFVFVIVAFAVMGQKLYGRQLSKFRDFGTSMMSLSKLSLGIGDDIFPEMIAANPDVSDFTTLYYFVFIFLASVVLVNIFLAILVDAFALVKESAAQTETVLRGGARAIQYDLYRSFLYSRKAVMKDQRFLTDERLMLLLDSHLRTLAQPASKGPLEAAKRAAALLGEEWGEEGDETERVLELSGGGRLTASEVEGVLRMLVGSQQQQESAERGAVSAFDDDRWGLATAVKRRAERVRASRETPTWLSSLRAALQDEEARAAAPQASEEGAEAGGRGEGEGEQESDQSRLVQELCRKMMRRFGTEVDDEELKRDDKKKIKMLKLEALSKQLDFFSRFDRVERKVDAFGDRLARVEAKLDRVGGEGEGGGAGGGRSGDSFRMRQVQHHVQPISEDEAPAPHGSQPAAGGSETG